ncbi:MAG: iron transporter, partial [Deltaproteobacteria bacterium]|nr:iron transporter [Deltaproteobacteria bacterium]
MNLPSDRLRASVISAFRRGVNSYYWLLKILIPISFITALLDYGGWIQKMDFLLEPLMAYLRLPASAALPILIGILTGVYGCIAAMAVLSFTVPEMTVIAVFVLIAHNLPQEGIIQAKSGIGFVKITLVRLFTAVVTGMGVALCLSLEPGTTMPHFSGGISSPPFLEFFRDWGLGMLLLCIKIFFILLGIMIIIELMKAFNCIERLVTILSPFLKIMGLKKEAGVLWLTGVLLGVSYGGAVIVEQAREVHLPPDQVEKLHLS